MIHSNQMRKTNTFIMSTVPLGVLSLFTNIEYICCLLHIFLPCVHFTDFSIVVSAPLHSWFIMRFGFCFSYASQVSHNLQFTHATTAFDSFITSSSFCFNSITRDGCRSGIIIIICSIARLRKRSQVFKDVYVFRMQVIINKSGK